MLTRQDFGIAAWCVGHHYPGEKVLDLAKRLFVSVELLPDKLSEAAQKAGVRNLMMLPDYGDKAPFEIGLAKKEDRSRVVDEAARLLYVARKYKHPRIIQFTGCYGRPTPEMRECLIDGLHGVSGYARRGDKQVILEHLNSCKFEGPDGGMKGHPGYSGDDYRWMAGVVRDVRSQGAKNVFLLSDVWHMWKMHGAEYLDLLGSNLDITGHVHFAQGPERGPVHDDGPIDFPAVMKVLNNGGYSGDVGIEYPVPQGAPDPGESLERSLRLCGV